MSRFNYIKYDETSARTQQAFKNQFEEIERSVAPLAEGRAKSLILTKLEEAYMWVGKAIRDDQIKRKGNAESQEERSNS